MMRCAPEGVTTFHELVGWNFDTQDVIIYLYLMALCLALFTLFVSNRVIRMPIGRAWEALREDEIACRSLGLNPTRITLSAFTIGAMFAGFAFFVLRWGWSFLPRPPFWLPAHLFAMTGPSVLASFSP